MTEPAVERGVDAYGAPRRVLLVAPQPFFRVTGTPINVLLMCQALTEAGFEVHLATLPEGEDVALPGLVLHRTLRLPGLGAIPVGFSGRKALYDVLLAGTVLRLLWRGGFEVVHAIEEAAFYAVPLARRFGIPAITDLDSDLCRQLRDHPSAIAGTLAGPARWLRRHALRRSAGVLTMASRMREIVRAESPATPVFQISDIPLESTIRPPDPARQAEYRRELGLEDRRLVVYTGNYDRRQGLEELVQAMVAVRERHREACLLVVGGQPDQIRRLQALVEQLGLGDAVRLAGPRPPDTMAEYMGLAEVLVSPRLEPHATPLKIFSYMASGRPIVATDLPTHTEVLDGTTAILVPPHAEGLAAGLIRALDEPAGAARLGGRAQRLVREKYTYARFKDQLIETYETILRTRTPAGVPSRTLAHGG